MTRDAVIPRSKSTPRFDRWRWVGGRIWTFGDQLRKPASYNQEAIDVDPKMQRRMSRMDSHGPRWKGLVKKMDVGYESRNPEETTGPVMKVILPPAITYTLNSSSSPSPPFSSESRVTFNYKSERLQKREWESISYSYVARMMVHRHRLLDPWRIMIKNLHPHDGRREGDATHFWKTWRRWQTIHSTRRWPTKHCNSLMKHWQTNKSNFFLHHQLHNNNNNNNNSDNGPLVLTLAAINHKLKTIQNDQKYLEERGVRQYNSEKLVTIAYYPIHTDFISFRHFYQKIVALILGKENKKGQV